MGIRCADCLVRDTQAKAKTSQTLAAIGWVCKPHRNLQGPNAMSEGSCPEGCGCSGWSREGTELSSFVGFASTSHQTLIIVTREMEVLGFPGWAVLEP